MKLLIKTVCFLVSSLIVVLLVEAGSFYQVLNLNRSPSPADAVVVFHGSSIRNQVGYRLANEGLAPLLTISPANADARNSYDKQYGHAGTWRHLIEERAETTFQNALLVSRLVRKNNLKKIILVTDAWHMPRSYLLLRMMLAGAAVHIQPFDTGAEPYTGTPARWSSKQKKRVYNEMVEFWGSIYEGVLYLTHGKLPERSLKERAWVKALRKALLVEVS